MKRLYNEHDDRYTEAALELVAEAHMRLGNIVSNWKAKGYSVRDIESIMQSVVTELCLMEVLDSRGYTRADGTPYDTKEINQ